MQKFDEFLPKNLKGGQTTSTFILLIWQLFLFLDRNSSNFYVGYMENLLYQKVLLRLTNLPNEVFYLFYQDLWKTNVTIFFFRHLQPHQQQQALLDQCP